MSAIPTKARQVVRERQGGACIRCGVPYSEVHHRQRRRDGGHTYENLIGLCGADHRFVHANPVKAKEQGYIVAPGVTAVADVPIKTFAGWVVLGEDGSITPVPPP